MSSLANRSQPDPVGGAMPTLRAAVNLLWCVPGQVGGSEEYLARQLLGLAEIDAPVRPTLFTPPGYAGAHPDLAGRYQLISPPGSGGRRSGRIVTEHTWLARRTRRQFDLVHHGGGTAPLIGARPVVLTVHDLQYLVYPKYFSPVKLRYLRAMMPRSVARAAVVTTPTAFVAATVVEAFGVDPDRVVVVPHGIPATSNAAVPSADEMRARYRLGDGPVLVYPAVTHPHKRHDLLLELMARHWTDPELRLVLLGGRGSADEQVMAQIASSRLGDRVLRPGRVPDADRDALIAMADALVFPSRYEGFGAPVLEAMALGTPVICADHPALREVVGQAALVVTDTAAAWASALADLPGRREELVAAGRERAARFTAAVSATALLEAYRRAVA